MTISQRNILIKSLLWFLTLFSIIFIGVTRVFAEEVDVGYVTSKTTILFENNQAAAMTSLPHTTSVNQYLYNILVIQLNNQSILKDYLYQLEIYTPNAKLKNISNIYIIGGNNNSTVCQTIGLDTSDTSYPKIYFTCPSNLNYLTFGLNNDNPTTLTEPITTSTNFQWNYTYLRYFTEEDDIDLGPVISNQTQNTQNIINNNNNNTQQIIDNQKELLGDKCSNEWNPTLKTATTHRGITFTPILKNGVVEKYIVNGTRTSASNAYVTIINNFTLEKGTHIEVYSDANIYLQLYDGTNAINTKDYTATETKTWSQIAIFTNQSPIDNAEFKVMISKNSSDSFCIYGTYISKIDKQNETSKGIFAKIKELFNWFNNDEDADISGLDNMVGWLPPGPVDSIINLPLSLFNALTNTLSGTCQAVSLTLPFINQTLTLPCFDTYMSQYLTHFSTLWQLVGFIVSVFILYNYLLALYSWVDATLTLRENNLPGYYGDNWGGGA